MAEVVFILGAGASAHTGAPVMKDFYNSVCDLYEDRIISKEDKEDFEAIREAKESLERILIKVKLDLNNLEIIFSLIEMGKLINRFPSKTSIDKLHEAIQRVIVRTIELKTNFFYENRNKAITADPYDELAQEIVKLEEQRRPSCSSILTFNYDVAIDRALERRVGNLNYCLYEERDSSINTYKLLKLHGSFNWAKYNKNGQIVVVPISIRDFVNEYCAPSQNKRINNLSDLPTKNGISEEFFQIDIGSRINRLEPSFYSGAEVSSFEKTPLIVPPTWSKTEYNSILRNVWSQAAKEISEARYIFVIGYSLPESDLFFQYLLALGMLDIHRLKCFWVIDRAEETVNRYREFLGPSVKEVFRESSQDFTHFVMEYIQYFLKDNKLIS